MFQDEQPLRLRLIDQLLRLSPTKLGRLAQVLHELECEGEPFSSESQHGEPVPQVWDWPHAPLHRISAHGTYLVTAGTLYKQHYFRRAECLDLLTQKLLELARQQGWYLEAWAVFSNHYHFVGHAQPGASALDLFLRDLHSDTATAINRLDRAEGRQVWFNYWDTQLTYERSYLARLNYVHQNPVKHGLVRVANQYRWCSAAWFERTATRAQVKTIYHFKIDQVRVFDDFEVLGA
jgi:putative transposase